MPLELPFAHLNLTRNPFGELPLEARGSLAVVDIEPFVSRLQTPGFVLQVLGEAGRGKTSHLLALHRQFPSAPYLHYPEGGPRPSVPDAPLVFLDETQRFSRRERSALFRRASSFVIATHEDHTREFNRADLQHETLHLRGVTSSHLKAIFTRRIEAARRSPGPVPTLDDALIHKLICSFGDDIRASENYLYEVFQALETPRPVTLNDTTLQET